MEAPFCTQVNTGRAHSRSLWLSLTEYTLKRNRPLIVGKRDRNRNSTDNVLYMIYKLLRPVSNRYAAFCSVFAFFGRIGMKLPTISEGLVTQVSTHPTSPNETGTHILCVSLRIVKEKQHFIVSSSSPSFFPSFLSVQLVKIAFWLLSNAIAPNFSQ
jgi:hypothetical protein